MTVQTPQNPDRVWYHSGAALLDHRNVLPGLHVGTYAQALMRAGRIITKITIDREVFARVKDDVTSVKVKKVIMAAHSQGVAAMRYLNRVEGIPLEEFERARKELKSYGPGLDLDTISDNTFCKIVPSAHDSLIILDPSIITSFRQVEKRKCAA